MVLLTPSEDEVLAFGEDADLISGPNLAGGHQAIERVLKLAGQRVLEVCRPIFGIAPMSEKQRFGAGSEFHLKRCVGMLEENPAGFGEFEVEDFLEVRGVERAVDDGVFNAAQKFRGEVPLERAH